MTYFFHSRRVGSAPDCSGEGPGYLIEDQSATRVHNGERYSPGSQVIHQQCQCRRATAPIERIGGKRLPNIEEKEKRVIKPARKSFSKRAGRRSGNQLFQNFINDGRKFQGLLSTMIVRSGLVAAGGLAAGIR